MAALLNLAAEEYGLGVGEDGRVVNRAEYEEADLFLSAVAEALPGLRTGASCAAYAALAARVDSARAVVARAGAPDELRRWTSEAVALLGREWGAELVVWPARAPSWARGRVLYGANCAACHGPTGRGDGPLAGGLAPPPPDFSDPASLAAGPERTFQVISYGIRGRAMAGFQDRLSPEGRWDLVAYVHALAGDSVSPVSYVRGRGVRFPKIHALVESSVRRGLAGDGAAARQDAIDAYLEFERVEGVLRARAADLTSTLERDFLVLRGLVVERPADARPVSERIHTNLARAERAVGSEFGRWSGVVESMTIILREGFEAMLIVGALLAFLTKAGAIEGIFHWGPASREALEGITLLLATAVLFSVSYWLVSKIEHAAWDRYLKGKVRTALARGSGAALVSVSFLAVYREGFETVLFYKALLGAGPSGEAVAAGFLVGLLLLFALFVLFYRFGVRIPLRHFFAVTGAVLYYMAFVFAGKGVHALQEAGWLAETWVGSAPYVGWLGLYPTWESLAAQGALVLALGLALLWVFLVKPIRLRSSVGPVAEASRKGSSAR